MCFVEYSTFVVVVVELRDRDLNLSARDQLCVFIVNSMSSVLSWMVSDCLHSVINLLNRLSLTKRFFPLLYYYPRSTVGVGSNIMFGTVCLFVCFSGA